MKVNFVLVSRIHDRMHGETTYKTEPFVGSVLEKTAWVRDGIRIKKRFKYFASTTGEVNCFFAKEFDTIGEAMSYLSDKAFNDLKNRAELLGYEIIRKSLT